VQPHQTEAGSALHPACVPGLQYGHPGEQPPNLRTAAVVRGFIGTVTALFTPHDITLREPAIQSPFPADDFTASELVRICT